MKKICLLICLISYVQYCFAQLEANFWFFGKNAGVDFSQITPIAVQNSAINTLEGCATVSDANGKLLFYTDGLTIWNVQHQPMPNGKDLKGNFSATQSAVIVPLPKSKHVYYVFTTDEAEGENGLRYSTVDMMKAKGLGDVVMKNILLQKPVTEKITVIPHQNKVDYWILVHQWDSNTFIAYLLTEKGIRNIPVLSSVGRNHAGEIDNAIGMMKASPDGKKIAVAIKGLNTFELFDFDNATGTLSHPLTFLMEANALTYGIEFSSDASKLYVSAHGKGALYQYDLSDYTPDKIKKSAFLVAQNLKFIGSLQLAPNGKIYISAYESAFLSEIKYPNLPKDSCQFIQNSLALESGKCQLGLPNFPPFYFEDIENTASIQANSMKKIKIGEVFTKNILFETEKYDILPEYLKELDDLVVYLKAVKNASILIAGHTDNEGEDHKNLELSTQRAKAVADYLIQKGIQPLRVNYIGYGETRPIALNNTPEGRKLNRRIEFLLKK